MLGCAVSSVTSMVMESANVCAPVLLECCTTMVRRCFYLVNWVVCLSLGSAINIFLYLAVVSLQNVALLFVDYMLHLSLIAM